MPRSNRIGDPAAQWQEALARLYERMAPTDELRALAERENDEASTHSHH